MSMRMRMSICILRRMNICLQGEYSSYVGIREFLHSAKFIDWDSLVSLLQHYLIFMFIHCFIYLHHKVQNKSEQFK